MSEFTEVTQYKCTKCGKLWSSVPVECTCARKYEPGQQINVFKLVERSEVGRTWRVICLLCDCYTDISTSNLRRQKSCGCCPKHIEPLSINDEFVRYKCNKCFSYKSEKLPVEEWCCDI
jgi:hypothetical protein